jgi:hypothetical protein
MDWMKIGFLNLATIAQHIYTNSNIPIVATCYHDNGLFVN